MTKVHRMLKLPGKVHRKMKKKAPQDVEATPPPRSPEPFTATPPGRTGLPPLRPFHWSIHCTCWTAPCLAGLTTSLLALGIRGCRVGRPYWGAFLLFGFRQNSHFLLTFFSLHRTARSQIPGSHSVLGRSIHKTRVKLVRGLCPCKE